MVVIVIGILIGLLLPVIAGALRTAKNAAVQAEINQLAQALANFKATYGDFPPSRVLLVENGNYTPYINSTQPVHTIDANASPNDTTVGVLAQRSLTAMRKFFPKVVFSTSGIPRADQCDELLVRLQRQWRDGRRLRSARTRMPGVSSWGAFRFRIRRPARSA